MSDCRVELITSSRTDPKRLEQIRQHPCPECRNPIGTHPSTTHPNVDPAMAYMVNRDRISRYPDALEDSGKP